MANLIHRSLCLENFGALGAWVCLVLALFMLFDVVKIVPFMRSKARTFRSSAAVTNFLAHLGQGKLCFVLQCWTDCQILSPLWGVVVEGRT